MFDLSPANLGTALLILGLGLSLLTLLLVRLAPRLHPFTQPAPRPPVELPVEQHGEAVLLVQGGGKVTYANQEARDWFSLAEEEPNLERLARRTRPSEAFLSLCAAEGQARLSLNGRLVEATSYFAPNGHGPAILLSLRRPQLVVDGDGAASQRGEVSHQALSIFTELSQKMAASLELETTLQAILEAVDRLIPSDFSEITIWEPENEHLVPYRFAGMAGLDRRLERASERYRSGQGYSGCLIDGRKPLLITDVSASREVLPAIDRRRYPIQSYLGVPLTIAGEFIGTLELASLAKESYTPNDLEVLRILSGQAAVALHNALLYKEEQQQAQELAGLANLARAVSSLRDLQDLFDHLIESASPLLQAEILGFFVYDENRRVLESQTPFLGVPEGIIEWAQAPIPPGSPAEALLQSGEPILTQNAPEDPRLQALGLQDFAQVACIRSAILAPLTSAGRVIGYLEAGNKRDGSPFDQDDLRLLAIIAGQAAPIIENAALVQQARRRAQRSETLRRVASLTGSTATLDEILRYSLLDLARLLQADMAGIFLLNENRGELRLHKPSLFQLSPEAAARLGRIPIDDGEQFPLTVTASRKQFVSGVAALDPDLPPVYRPLFDHLQVQSVVHVPLIVRERGIGEMFLGSLKPNFFTRGDVLSIATAGGQLAAAIEQASLYSQTDQSLRQRVEQMTALTRISRELNNTLDLEHLLRRVFEEAVRTTGADCGAILLLQAGEDGRSEPRIALSFGDHQPGETTLQALEQAVLEQGEALVVEDFELTGPAALSSAPAQGAPAHSGVRSALVVPIAYQGRVAGLIHLHAKEPGRFDRAAREIGEALAVQAATALGNAHRYQEQVKRGELLDRRVDTLSKLYETSQIMQADRPLEEALEAIGQAIQATTQFEAVLVSVYDANSDNLKRVAALGMPAEAVEELAAHPQPWPAIEQLLQPEFRLGSAYFIPAERLPAIPPEVHTITVLPLDEAPRTQEQWHPDDFLLAPLLSAGGEPLGLISLDAPRNHLRPDRAAIETLEIFSSQAALAIESQARLCRLKEQIDVAQEELEQTQEATRETQESLADLEQKNLEQTQVILNLSERSRRITTGLDIVEIVNRQSSRSGVLLALGEEILFRMVMTNALVVEPGSSELENNTAVEPRLIHALGSIPAGVNPEALLGQRNPLRQALQNGKTILAADLEEHPEWQGSPLLNTLDAKAFICLPVMSEGRAEAAVLATCRGPLAPFTDEDELLFNLLARQAAIALQNLNLYEETHRRLREVSLLLDFSRQLGSLDPASVLQALVDSATHVVPAAQAALVALWDPAEEALAPRAASGYAGVRALMEMRYRPGESIPGQVFQAGEPLRLDEVQFTRHYNLSSENLRRYRNATANRMPVSSLALPIAAAGQKEGGPMLGVLVLDNFQESAAFTGEDQALVASLAQQTALTLENARLYRASEQRTRQLQALTGVAATITSSLQINDLIATLLNQLESILPYDTGTLWLRQGKQLVVRAARGFADDDQRTGIAVDVEDSRLLHEMIVTGQPISAGDVQADPRFQSLMEYERLSWLGLPLIASGEVTGVIALEKSEANFYTPDHVQVATTFAGQAAVALENAHLYEESLKNVAELDQRSRVLGMLNRLSTELSRSLDVGRILEFAVQELHQALGGPEGTCSAVTAILFDGDGRASLAAETPSLETGLPLPLAEAPLFERLRQTMGVFNSEDASQEPALSPLMSMLARYGDRSLLVLPMATGNELHGLLAAHTRTPHRFEAGEVELARTIANQAAVAFQNARLFAETRSLSEDLEARVNERTAELAREHQRTEILLRIITELSASLDLDQVLNRTLHLLNEIVDAAQITVLIARPGEKKLHRLASIGYTEPPPEGGSATPFNPDQGLAGWVIAHRKAAQVEDLTQDPRWVQLESGPGPQHRSALAVPLMIGAEALGALMLFHPSPTHFSVGQMDLVQAAANQVAVAVNNAELYRLIRDQAEDLGSMLRNQQVETSRSKAILEAVADGVLVTDAKKEITLFNASAEHILGLQRGQVLGKSLEYFSGLFGRAAQSWRETISTWSQNPNSYQPGETFTEQITLENGRVVSVRLAPVIMRRDFLGTVSIFQDITHQVEVDRLKSEFVATVSHELRTPMTSIKGYVDVLLMGAAGALSEQQDHFLQVVKTNTERLAVLVNDLLDISRIESGKAALSIQPLNLEEVVDEAVADAIRRSMEENKPVTIEKDIPGELPRVLGDLDRVRQIVENLVDNAYQYNTANGRITICIRPAGGEIQVDVQDTGMGIPLEEQPRVFERFYRGENPLVMGVAGTGLGLSIVQNLIQMQHGRIWLESSGIPGEGSTFSFTLPAYTPEA